MTHPRIAAATAAVIGFFLVSPALSAGTPPRHEGDAAWRDAASLAELVVELEDWLDANSDYPRNSAPVTIEIADPITIAMRPETSSSFGSRTRGLYDHETARIYLVEPWSRENALDVSVLLHELVHHRQVMRHWYCPAAQEPDAYDLQQAWLAERGLKADVDRLSVVLAAGCTPRDIHPD